MAERAAYEMVEYSWFQITGLAAELPRPHYVGRGIAYHAGYDSRVIKQAPMPNHGVFKLALSEGSIVGQGRRSEPVRAGQGVLRMHGQPQVWDAYNPRHTAPLHFIGIIFTGEIAIRTLHALTQQHGHIYQLDLGGLLVQRLMALAREPTHTVHMTAGEGYRLMTDLFLELIRSGEKPLCPAGVPAVPQAAERIMARDLSREFSVEQLASQLDCSREHLTREFTRHFGVPPHRYAMQLRIREAATRLRDTREPIKGISSQLGFSSRLTFIRTFKKIMGMTPSEYRAGSRRLM